MHLARTLGMVLCVLAASVIVSVTPDSAGRSRAWAEEKAAEVSSGEAQAAITAFKKAYKTKDVDARVEAVEMLGANLHPKVAEQLLKTFGKAKSPEILSALFRALGRQTSAAEKIRKKVDAWLWSECKAERKRIKKGVTQFRVDPKTGEPDLDSEEGQRRLAETKSRGMLLREAIRCARLLPGDPPKEADRYVVWLQDPLDDLVVELLQAIGQWRLRDALRDILALFKMYPNTYTWDSGAVEHPGGTDASAKQEWMARFGHPGKQCKRPKLVEAIQACLSQITGEAVEKPEDLEAWLKKSR